VFVRLSENLRPFPKQHAFQELLTDRDGQSHALYIANNDGASSSILPFGRVQELYPEISYVGEIGVTSKTLPTFLSQQKIEVKDYDALVLDTQGAELLILKGAGDLLRNFRFIQTEAADFESYAGCCRLSEIDSFLLPRGFQKIANEEIRSMKNVGTYFEVVYARR